MLVIWWRDCFWVIWDLVVWCLFCCVVGLGFVAVHLFVVRGLRVVGLCSWCFSSFVYGWFVDVAADYGLVWVD